MNRGGIFNGPTALGIPEQGIFNNAAPLGSAPRGIFRNAAPMGLGSVNVGQCVFATWTKSAGAQAIQEEMIRRGATNLKADGLWGPCSESAWQKITGVPLTRASLESKFGVTCSLWNKAGTFDVSKCTNGTDVVTVKPPPEVINVPPPGTTTTPQVVCNPPYVPDPATGGCKMGATTPPPVSVTVPPAAKPPVPASPPPAAKTDEWIKGVPNLAVIGAGVFVVGGLAIFLLTRKGSSDAVANATMTDDPMTWFEDRPRRKPGRGRGMPKRPEDEPYMTDDPITWKKYPDQPRYGTKAYFKWLAARSKAAKAKKGQR